MSPRAFLVGLALVAAPLTWGGEAPTVDYLSLVRRYADAMLEFGTDRYGEAKTPQFAGLLIRRDPPELPQDAVYAQKVDGLDPRDVVNHPLVYKGNNRAHKITYRGGDVADDAGLYQTLYRLSVLTSDPRYAEAADASLRWFLAHAVQQETGLPAWGEHTGWDFRSERADQGFPFDLKHELDGRWPLYEKFFELQPVHGPDDLSVMENFARGLWFGAVSLSGRTLLYGRHGSLTEPSRPTEGEWAQFGMFPRHGGYYVDLWARAIRKSRSVVFRRWMEPRFERFVRALEQQVAAEGFPVYLEKGEVRRHPEQMASMAWDLDEAAVTLAEIWPQIGLRLHLLAERIDDNLIQHEDELDPALARLRWLARGKRDKRVAALFGKQFLAGAYALTKLDDLPERPLGEKVAQVAQPGRIPEQYADAIGLLLDAADAVEGEAQAVYLAGANHLADKAIEHFFDDDSPLPKSLDRPAKLLDGSPYPSFYQSYLGADDLMWALLRLHEANQAH
ncbi:MAG: hypothetical protein KDC27_21610 [Acidobacteria bacterium]|nr:hypothetical protein [Acidobacteriota bacterium]